MASPLGMKSSAKSGNRCNALTGGYAWRALDAHDVTDARGDIDVIGRGAVRRFILA